MRTIINIGIGLLLLLGAGFVFKWMVDANKKPKRKAKKIVKTVFVDTVHNRQVPIMLKANGTLVAKNKIELFSEVQGVLQPTTKEFKAGVAYKKGEVMLKINSDEEYTRLQAQKSTLYNTITSIIPDVRLDFPEEYPKWRNYLSKFDFDKPTPKLPKANSEKEKFFISSRNIYTTFYNVKNLEVRLQKYTLRAPYNGVLTEALVNTGSLVRQGQKLGEFINPHVFEMEVSINANYIDLLKTGASVTLRNLDNSLQWQGTIIRINGKVDQASQTVKTYIRVAGEGLKEGMYLEAHIKAKNEHEAFVIPRTLLVNNQKVYAVQDSALALLTVNPVYFKDKSVIVKGLPEGTIVLKRPIPGAYQGMKVKIGEALTNPKN